MAVVLSYQVEFKINKVPLARFYCTLFGSTLSYRLSTSSTRALTVSSDRGAGILYERLAITLSDTCKVNKSVTNIEYLVSMNFVISLAHFENPL